MCIRDRFCRSCQCAKATRKPAKRNKGSLKEHEEEKPECFGHKVTGDIVLARARSLQDDTGTKGERLGFVMNDLYSDWLEMCPGKDRRTDTITVDMLKFQGPNSRQCVQSFRSDNAGELTKAAESIGWLVDKSTPYRSTSNAIAERSVRRVLDGTRTLLFHSGMPRVWWPYAAKHYCWLHNVMARKGLPSPYFMRFKRNFKGCLLYTSPSPRDLSTSRMPSSA